MFVNTQALRVDLSGKPDTASLLAQVRATSLAAQANQDLPFEQVVEAVTPVRSLNHSPVFQVMFALQNMPEEQLVADGLTFSDLPAEVTTAQVDLSLMMYETEAGLEGMLNYATALFDEATVQRYSGYWQQLLEGMIAQPELPVAALPLLSDAEYQQVVHTFNATAQDYPAQTCLQTLFEQRVQSSPDAIAVVSSEQQLTYDALNRQANQLAHWLREQGVRPDSRVAMALPRGFELTGSILATIKAGGCYVPVDPHYPADRIAHILTDSAPEVLIVTQATLAILTQSAELLYRFVCGLP